MGMIDFIIIVVIILSGLFAFYRGLVRELLTLVSWTLAVLCGFFSMFAFRPITSYFIENEQIAYAVTAAVVAIVVLVVCTLITAKINKGLRKSVLSSLDRTLGFIFGLLRGVVVVIGIYFFCVFAMSPRMLRYYEEKNLLLGYMSEFVPVIEDVLPDNWIDNLHAMKSGQSENPQAETSTSIKLDEAAVKAKPESAPSTQEEAPYDAADLKSMDNLIKEIE